MQLVNEGERGVLNILHFEARTARCIEQQDKMEWLFDRTEIRDLLLDVVFVKVKVAPGHGRNKFAVPVKYAHRNGDQRRFNLDRRAGVLRIGFRISRSGLPLAARLRKNREGYSRQ